MNRWRYRLALVTYWTLFIVLPLGALVLWLGAPQENFAVYMVALVVLVMVGERGFRSWKKLWKVDTIPTTEVGGHP